MTQFCTKFQKPYFCPFQGQISIFPEKWHHHLKRLMVFYLYAKNNKKRLNGSKDIVIWKIEQSDWPRAFMNKSREWEFSQIWDLPRKLANHNTLLFRSFLAKTNDSILHKSPKTLFCPFLSPFCPKSREREFSQIWDLRRKLANHNTLHFRSFLAKTNDWILRKCPKTLFLGLFGPFFPIFQKMRIFPKNRALSLLSIYGPLTSCKISEKTNESIQRKVRY